MKNRSFLENTSYSSLILIATKMLGVIPVFFMGGLLGYSGLSVYAATYAVAVVALEVATGGIPLGIAQFVSRSNAVGDYRTSDKAIRMMLAGTFLLSTCIGLVLFLLAPLFASASPESIRESVTFSIRMFIPTIIVAPVLGVVRGFYNGNKDTVPGAYSQLIEQIVWIVSIFGLIFFANIISKDNTSLKSGMAILANFVGVIGAGYILYSYWDEHRESWNYQVDTQKRHRRFTNQQIFLTIVVIALPSVLMSLVMNSFQMVTNFFYNGVLQSRYSEEMIKATFATLQFNSAKFVSIPLVIANTIALTTLPFMAAAFKKRDKKGVRIQIKQSMLLSYSIVIFSAFAILVFGPMLYHGLFFQSSDGNVVYDMKFHALNTQIIRIDGFRGLFMGIAALMNVILITINQRWKAVQYVVIGFIAKCVLTPLLLFGLGPVGDIAASIIAYAVIIVLAFSLVSKGIKFPKRFYRQFIMILIVNIIVAVIMYVMIRLFGYQFTKTNRIITIIEVIIIGTIGMGIYGYILYRLKILKYMLQKRV